MRISSIRPSGSVTVARSPRERPIRHWPTGEPADTVPVCPAPPAAAIRYVARLPFSRVLDVDHATGEGDARSVAVGDHLSVAKHRFQVRDASLDEHVVVADLCDLFLRVTRDESARASADVVRSGPP